MTQTGECFGLAALKIALAGELIWLEPCKMTQTGECFGLAALKIALAGELNWLEAMKRGAGRIEQGKKNE